MGNLLKILWAFSAFTPVPCFVNKNKFEHKMLQNLKANDESQFVLPS